MPESERRDWLRLSRAAALSLGAHLIAGLAMACILRRGLDTNADLADRLSFLSEHRTLWRAAWGTWNLAALCVLGFFSAFSRAHRLGGAAVRVGVAAVAADLTAEAIEMWVLPGLPPAAYTGHHRFAVLLTGGFANGLYTLASVMLLAETRRQYPFWVVAAGAGVGLGGIWLSAAALMGSVDGMFWSNVLLVPSLLLWQSGVSREAYLRARGGGKAEAVSGLPKA